MKTKEMIVKFTTNFLGLAFVGILFFAIAVGTITAVGTAVGFSSGEEVKQFAGQFALDEQTGLPNIMGIFIGLGVFAFFGALATAFAWLTIKVHNMVQPDHQMKLVIIKKHFLLPFIAVGGLTFVLIFMLGQVADGIDPNMDITNPMNLIDATLAGNIGFVVLALFMFALTALFLVAIVKMTPTISKLADKTHANKI